MASTPLSRWLMSQLNQANMSQAEVARRSGVSKATISHIRHGHIPEAAVLRALAGLLPGTEARDPRRVAYLAQGARAAWPMSWLLTARSWLV